MNNINEIEVVEPIRVLKYSPYQIKEIANGNGKKHFIVQELRRNLIQQFFGIGKATYKHIYNKQIAKTYSDYSTAFVDLKKYSKKKNKRLKLELNERTNNY